MALFIVLVEELIYQALRSSGKCRSDVTFSKNDINCKYLKFYVTFPTPSFTTNQKVPFRCAEISIIFMFLSFAYSDTHFNYEIIMTITMTYIGACYSTLRESRIGVVMFRNKKRKKKNS